MSEQTWRHRIRPGVPMLVCACPICHRVHVLRHPPIGTCTVTVAHAADHCAMTVDGVPMTLIS